MRERAGQGQSVVRTEVSTEFGQKIPFVFAISLRAKQASKDWRRVTDNLNATLDTIFANQAQNIEIIICGHDKPDFGKKIDSLVTWISASWPPPSEVWQYSTDKIKKRRKIGVYLRQKKFEGFFFPMDADDWVSSELVEYIRSYHSHHKESLIYIFDSGYMVNWASGDAKLRKKFYRGCGSSSVFYFRTGDLPLDNYKSSSEGLLFEHATSTHKRIVERAISDGIQFSLLDRPLVAWVLGHGENNSTWKGRSKENFNPTCSIYDDELKHIRPSLNENEPGI